MKLLLVDLSHIFWSTWHATAGQDVDAAYRVSLQRIVQLRDDDGGYDATVICCDIGKSWRHEVYPEYKAGRPERDQAAYDQLRRLREQLEADGLPVLAVEKYEADDIIATLACKAPAAGYEVTIASGDKDLLQLVGPGTIVHSTNAGGGWMSPPKVFEKFGVKPDQLRDYLALVGDKSDNVPGAPGVGPKHAARLLTELGSIDNMYAAIDGVTPPGIRESLTVNRKQVELARKLVSLSYDVPLDFTESIKPREKKKIFEGTLEAPDDVDDEGLRPGGDVPLAGKPAGRSGEQENAKSGQEASPNPARATPAAETSAAKPALTQQQPPSVALVLDKQDPRWLLAMEPKGLNQLWWLAEKLAESQMYRKFPNADAIAAAVLKGRSMGLDMMTSLDCIHVIKGKPTLAAMAIVGVVLASGKAEYFDLIETTATSATWATKRKGRDREITLTYTIEEADAAGLLKPSEKGEPSNYIKRPRPMLRKQCAVELARTVYPDVVANVYDPDEIEAA